MATRRSFTQEYRDQAVSLHLDSGRSIAEVARSIGVHEMTLGKWVKKVKDSGRVQDKDLPETERAELERLRKDNAVLRMERISQTSHRAPQDVAHAQRRRRPLPCAPGKISKHATGHCRTLFLCGL